MRHLFRLTALLLLPLCAEARQADTTHYCFPLKEVAGYYSANFGEMRTNHFHSGVDIKTDGTVNKPVVAVADGYISRIFCSPTGYGRALYITHPNGTTSVYGHLLRFSPKVEEYLLTERYRQRKNRIDLYCDSTRFRVRRGEEIARSGNSGNSFGPHLHFEIRDNRSGQTLNTIASGIIRPKDNIPPYIQRIHYIEVDTVRGVPVEARRRSYEVNRSDAHTYKLKEAQSVPVGRRGYFLVETSDRKNDVSNTFGIYRLKATVDGECYFEYRMDGFAFDHTRYCNAVSYYPLQATSRNEVIRIALAEGNRPQFYRTMKNRGIVSAAPGQQREILIEAEDDCGNRSQLRFQITGKNEQFRAEADSAAIVVHRDRTFRHDEDGLSVIIPKGTLYESCFYKQEKLSTTFRRDTTLIVLSPVFRILDASTPLHKAMTVSVRTFVPVELQQHSTLCGRNRKGKLVHLGGKYENNAITARLRSAGELCVVADTVAPRIRPQFQSGADLAAKRSLVLKISDNFSGINSYSAHIDGRWVPIDYSPIQGTLTLPFDESLQRGREHTLTITATDGCGNTARWRGTFRK